MLALSGELAPIVGQQTTLTAENAGAVGPRIDLLIERARTPFVLKDDPNARECDLIVKTSLGGETRGWLFDPSSNPSLNLFLPDAAADPPISDADLRALAALDVAKPTDVA